MKRLSTLLVAALTAAAVLARDATPVSAQMDLLDLGVHLARANDIYDGSTGIGGQVGVNLPAFPLSFRVAVDRFFTDCPEEIDDCGAWGFTVDGNLAFPLPLLSPYASAGLVRRSVDPIDPLAETSHTGFALGAGLRLGLVGLNAFGEMRRELIDGFDDQWMFRLGVLF